jgi:four helix bundle protein
MVQATIAPGAPILAPMELKKGENIAERLLLLAIAVAKLCKTLPHDRVGSHVSFQTLRASTGSGANYEEARAAESRADFIHKVALAAKEMRETIYWLRFIAGAELSELDVQPMVKEARELVAILVASGRTARAAGRRAA